MLFYRVLIKVSKGQILMIRMWTLRLGGHTIAYGMLLYKSFLILFFIVRRHKDLFFRKIFVGKSNFCTVTLNLYLLFWCEDVTICLISDPYAPSKSWNFNLSSVWTMELMNFLFVAISISEAPRANISWHSSMVAYLFGFFFSPVLSFLDLCKSELPESFHPSRLICKAKTLPIVRLFIGLW